MLMLIYVTLGTKVVALNIIVQRFCNFLHDVTRLSTKEDYVCNKIVCNEFILLIVSNSKLSVNMKFVIRNLIHCASGI